MEFINSVPKSFVEVVQHRLDIFNRKMTKRGLETATMTLGATSSRRACESGRNVHCYAGHHSFRCGAVIWIEVTLTAPDIKHAGWHLVASVDDVGGKPVFRNVPGRLIISDRFKTMSPNTCEHCNIDRHRTETFIIGHDDGREMIIGRQCIRDYLGWDIAPLLNYWSDLASMTEDDGEGGYGSYVEYTWTPDQIIMAASQAVAIDGFYFKRDHEKSTAGTVRFIIDPPRTMSPRERADYDRYTEQSDKTQHIFDLTMEELAKVDPNNGEWNYNLSILRDAKRVTGRHIGILASAVILGLRRIESPERQERPVATRYGHQGEKVSLVLRVVRTNEFYGDYGKTTILTMTDDAGHDFTWFATGSHPVADGDTLDITGTIKGYDEFKGFPKTVLTRCKYTVKSHAQEGN
jgi:hypothetical protein